MSIASRDITTPGRFFLTPYAVRQYIRRVGSGMTYDQAIDRLHRLTDEAYFVKRLPTSDAELWSVELWLTRGPEQLRLIVQPGNASLPAVSLPAVVGIVAIIDQTSCAEETIK